MFDYIKGFITDKRKSEKGTFLTLEANNIGYSLEINEQDFINSIVDENNLSKFFITLIHREDAMILYGFSNKEARDIFQILISVSGVGAKMAIALLNEFDACDLISFVINGHFKELTRAKGVGPKLAQKIILELKDRLIKTDFTRSTKSLIPQNPAIEDTRSVLLSLGYEDKEIDNALSSVLITIEDSNNSEEILRKTLTTLSMNL